MKEKWALSKKKVIKKFWEMESTAKSRGVGAILNKNTNICMAFIIHGEIRYTFGVITYNFYLFTVLPTKISSNIIHLNTNGVFRLCSK